MGLFFPNGRQRLITSPRELRFFSINYFGRKTKFSLTRWDSSIQSVAGLKLGTTAEPMDPVGAHRCVRPFVFLGAWNYAADTSVRPYRSFMEGAGLRP